MWCLHVIQLRFIAFGHNPSSVFHRFYSYLRVTLVNAISCRSKIGQDIRGQDRGQGSENSASRLGSASRAWQCLEAPHHCYSLCTIWILEWILQLLHWALHYIGTLWRKLHNLTRNFMDCSVILEPHDGDDEAEAKLRERRPTSVNTDELLGLMEMTRVVRRAWISTDGPTISDILRRYPRLADMPQAVCLVQSECIMVMFEAVPTIRDRAASLPAVQAWRCCPCGRQSLVPPSVVCSIRLWVFVVSLVFVFCV